MSEFELITLRNRLQRGRENRSRGEWFAAVPIGYLKLPTGEVILEPDEQARAVVQLIFEKFQELGTARGVCRYLIRHNIRLGSRCHKGPNRGQLDWRRPQPGRIAWMLHHPDLCWGVWPPVASGREKKSEHWPKSRGDLVADARAECGFLPGASLHTSVGNSTRPISKSYGRTVPGRAPGELRDVAKPFWPVW